MSFLSIGATALNAAQLGLVTTEHNIANASTEGYNRQRIGQAPNIALATGAGFIGQGTHVETISRVFNQFITNQVNQSQTVASELETYYDQVALIDNMLADPNAGLSPALQDFFRGVQTVAASPASAPARQALVSSSEALVSRFQGIESRLSELYESVNGQLQSTVGGISSLAAQVAELNQRIVVAEAAVAQPANDLLDQRDQLIGELNKLVRVSTVAESDGSLSVFIGNGQQLVVGVRPNTLQFVPSAADPERFTVAWSNGTSAQELPESIITGGSLAGLLRFRSESLDKAANALGQVAASLALTFNAQHDLGQDLLGGAGAANIADFFTLSSPKVIANQLNTGTATVTASFVSPPPLRLNDGKYSLTFVDPASAPVGVTPGYYLRRADGSLAVTPPSTDLQTVLAQVSAPDEAVRMEDASFFAQLKASDYKLSVVSVGVPNVYSLTRLSDNTPLATGDISSINNLIGSTEGFVLTEQAGSLAVGDNFLIQPTREIARNLDVNALITADPRRVATALPVRTEALSTNTGSGQISFESTVPGADLPTAAAPISLTFDSTTNRFTVSGAASSFVLVTTASGKTLTDLSAVVPPATIPSTIPFVADALVTIDGISFRIAGAPKQGDQFLLAANTGGIADGRNALALGQLQTQQTMEGATTSFQSAYGKLVSDVGNKTREVRVTRDAQQKLLEQAQSAREAQSGVNLDEEASNLLKFQQAYQAAARIMDMGSRLFDEILSIAR